MGWSPSDEPPSRTLDDVLAQIAPDRTWSDLLAWPPDVFAVASAALSDSSAYRLVVSPTSHSWPPAAARPGEAWRDEVRTADGRQDDIPSVQLTFAAAEQIP